MSDWMDLITDYFDGDRSPEKVARLCAWLKADPANARRFVREAMVHCHLHNMFVGAEAFSPEGLGRASLLSGESMVLPAVHDEDLPADVEPLQAPSVPLSPSVAAPPGRSLRERIADSLPRLRLRSPLVYGIAASLILLSLISLGVRIWWPSSPQVTLTASVGAAWDTPDEQPVLGSALAGHKVLRLTDGYAEFTYSSGAKVLIEGPARVTLDPSNRLTLESGRLTAQVPVPAHGFTVVVPTGAIVDLGTEFGVAVNADGSSKVVVFKGRVEARPTGGSAGAAVTLTKGQGASLDTTGVVMEQADPAAVDEYVRNITQIRTALPVHNTGDNLDAGSEDPYWQLTGDNQVAKFSPKPTIVLPVLDPQYVPNSSISSWIAPPSDTGHFPSGLFTFMTTFDLSGLAASTAHLNLRIAADDGVDEIRLNGKPTGLQVPVKLDAPNDSGGYSKWHDFNIDSGFAPGVNTLEFVVHNVADQSPMGLRVELSGSALRQAEQH